MKNAVIIFSFLFVACNPYKFEAGRHSYLMFENNSNLDIAVDRNSLLFSMYETSNILKSIIDANTVDMVVYANSTKRVLAGRGQPYEHKWFEKYDTLIIYVLDYKKILNTNPNIDTIDVLLQRYDLTLDDLNKINWTLSYPPDERMKDIKMYPPYQE
jgi:hypothetical protein